jgi:hypothetical protein
MDKVYAKNGVVHRVCEEYILPYISNRKLKHKKNDIVYVNKIHIDNIVKTLIKDTENLIPKFNNNSDIEDIKMHKSYIEMFIYCSLIDNKCKFY